MATNYSSKQFRNQNTPLILMVLICLLVLSSVIQSTNARPVSKIKSISNEQIKTFTTFANYASAAYCRVEDIVKWDCPTCKTVPETVVIKVITAPKTDTQVFIAKDSTSKQLIVSYRGTVRTSFRNILTDGSLVLRPYPPAPNAKVHTGFFKAFLESRKDVIEEVTNFMETNPDFKVVLTGHSLGGAIATLTALDLVQNNKKLVSEENLFIFTYGLPRIGNQEFANFVDSQLKLNRIVNFEDAVPRLPPKFLDYKHSGSEFWISDPAKAPTDAIIECQGQEDNKCSLSVKPLKLNIRDHEGPYIGVSMEDCPDFSKSNSDEILKLLEKA
ncbi:8252_t:CDS:2 [Entrophospora sp. SA101]|nr:7813_t:CDS:2 [Entrophospora sp. SA101]CAJ0927021.1 8252_t:CDS:2 [Entrophospora sp. SA101]